MCKVKIYGAGSIGSHLSHAARTLGWEVDLCDIDEAALERTKREIYPSRYGAWDTAINLYPVEKEPRDIYDLIFVGTPPESHLELAISAIEEKPKAVLVEKPLCTPNLKRAQELYELATNGEMKVFVGYDHVVGKTSLKVKEKVESGTLGPIETMDVEFREHWGGIFAAHPWLAGPADTYLGYWARGGGATGEHSHALNLWQYFAHVIGAGRVVEVSATADYVTDGGTDYDKICAINLKTESGLVGRVAQDVVTIPPRKWGRIQGRNGYVEWHFGHKPGRDVVSWCATDEEPEEYAVDKTRPDDFIAELEHIRGVIEGNENESPISIERGLDTMLVIAAAHRSAREGRAVKIDYVKGYRPSALDAA